ncbi:MAG: hypothetical protein ACRENU_04805 [Gemmatimonadaceae bacterium]
MRVWVPLMAAGLALADAAPAQEAKDSVLRRATGALAPGTLVLIATPANRWTAELRRVSGDSIHIGLQQQTVGVRFSAIDSLWRRGNSERLMSNVGMITLGVVGAAGVFAVYFGAAESGSSFRGEQIGAIALGALGGAAVGWFTGALIGKAIPRWVRLYPTSR